MDDLEAGARSPTSRASGVYEWTRRPAAAWSRGMDVAALLARPAARRGAPAHRVLYVNGGEQPLDQALEAVLSD